MSDFSALGFDPAPGDISAVRGFIAQLDHGARSTAEALSLMEEGDGSWEGEAAAAFRQTLDDAFLPQLRDVHDAFAGSRDALSTWQTRLTDFQSRARLLEDEARAAQAVVNRRSSELAQARDDARADPVAAAENTDLADADRRARTAQAGVDDVRRRAHALEREVDSAAATCASALKTGVALIAAYKGSRWDQFTEWVGEVGSAIADGYTWFMDNVMPILEDIIDTIGPIVAVLALFIPALGPLALALAIAAVAIDGLQALRGEEGAAEDFFVGLAGLAMGGALGKLGKALGDGTRQVLVPVVQGSGGAALAGGGTAAGSLTLALRFSPKALQANTMWMATKMGEAHLAGGDLTTALGQPAANLIQRGRNLVTGHGPRTDQELIDRDGD